MSNCLSHRSGCCLRVAELGWPDPIQDSKAQDKQEDTIFAWRSASLGSLAAILYVCATVVWIGYCDLVPLTEAYPFMAMSFVLVPALSALFLGERVFSARSE